MSLGEQLRAAREGAGLSVEDLASKVAMRAGLISEMESNKFSNCGGDTYARGHIRNITIYLGVGADEFLKLYDQEHSSELRNIQDQLVENNVMRLPTERKRISWKILAAISLTVIATVAIFQIVISNNQSSTPAQTIVATAAPSISETSPSTLASAPQMTSTPTAEPNVAAIKVVTLDIFAARGNSYIDIVVDGKHVETGSIFQNEKKSYKGSTAISVYFSNPVGLDVVVNGKALAPLGGANQEVRRTFR